MSMTPERTKELRRLYRLEMDAADETLTCALCETYKEITGRSASDWLREKIADAIQFDS